MYELKVLHEDKIMEAKYKPWEYLAIELLYINKDPVTIAVISRNEPNVMEWLQKHLKTIGIAPTHIGVWAVPVTLY
jgi:hypothetical protein